MISAESETVLARTEMEPDESETDLVETEMVLDRVEMDGIIVF
jgi:hypothetical protein